jgi:protein-S-isoprenylcysteine O-methyltransferase Ste14
MSHRAGLGAEHPLNDKVQAVFLVVFLGVWGLDSFVFRFSTVFAGVVPFFVRLSLAVLSFAVGIYLGGKSLAAIFGKADGKPTLVTTGVYAWVRHPMYLASLLVLLTFFLTTLSVLSLLVWVGLFAFYDRMATYEERDLQRIVGSPGKTGTRKTSQKRIQRTSRNLWHDQEHSQNLL